MNKSISIIALSLLATVFSCNKTEEICPEETGNLVTISATISSDDQDVKGANIKKSLSWEWSEDDKLAVVGKTTEIFKINEDFTPKQADFTGKAVDGSTFSILYPGVGIEKTDWSAQIQKGNNNVDHLRYEAALEGVNEYMTFSFSPEWAAAHGGSLKQTGVIQFDLSLPAEVTSAIAVTMAAESSLFYSGNGKETVNKISVQLQDVTLKAGENLVAWATTSWEEANIPAGTILTISVNTGSKTLSQEIVIKDDTKIKSGALNTIVLGAEGWAEGSHYASGKGTAERPWVIETVDQLLFVKDDLLSGATRYFKLGADLDMTGVEWTPLNCEEPFDKGVDFDGNGHTISNFSCSAAKYPGFFGVLYGSVHDLNFAGAKITSTENTAAGVVAGYCGSKEKHGKMINVHVTGTVTNSGVYAGTGGLAGKGNGADADYIAIDGCSFEGEVSHTGGKNGVAGIIGVPGNMQIRRCHVNAKISSNANLVGGIAGYEAGTIAINDCWSEGEIHGNQRVGGIMGCITKNNTTIRNCFSTSAISAGFVLGGIAGHASLDKWSADSSEPGNAFENCIAWNEYIKTTAEPSDTYQDKGSSGAIVGYCSVKNTLKDCFRKADLEFSEIWTGNVPYDQENADATTPLVESVIQKYNYPYHGKAAAADATISSVAQNLGWSAEIWDFSGNTPKLK